MFFEPIIFLICENHWLDWLPMCGFGASIHIQQDLNMAGPQKKIFARIISVEIHELSL